MNRDILTNNDSMSIYRQFRQYFINEHDLTKYFTDSFIDSKSLTLRNISKILSYHIFNIHPNTSVIHTTYINNLVDIIKPKIMLYDNNKHEDTNKFISGHFATNRLTITHKPYIIYMILYTIRKIFNIYMYNIGYINIIDPSTRIRVWIKYNKKNKYIIPLVFLHGFGFGIVPYISKINKLSHNRTIIIPEIPNISYDFYKNHPPSINNIIYVLHDILLKQNITRVDLIGHSFGTMILNAFQLKYPDMCNCKTYAEPTCFYIQQPHIMKIGYKSPRLTFNFKKIIKYLIYQFIFRDQYIQYIIKRCIFEEHALLNNFDNKTNIILAKDDYLVPSVYIYNYITTYYSNVNVYMTDGNHGSWIMDHSLSA